ncbi:class I SAM-dependent methyltransferase [Candidatus Woesearchaeota archaeon]|nr:class I SAM-dependent methyltransferase [Candidatus Woesearchaeota archaeon]MCF7900816.1 class I SAM-dependent methyltransferase [Candidatus Woesearchaeota archaeon]MCF8013118.1 class I SAM-dependent methyltransferase [Candidatus Woesearchaeota archaeon]
MGMPKSIIAYLMNEGLKRPFSGSVLTLGTQDVYITYAELQKLAKKYGFKLKNVKKTLSSKKEFASENFISDVCLFESLGFSHVQSLDLSKYESSNIIFDLNSEKIPSKYKESFDVIFDGGTIEHVFHTPNFLKNTFNFLKVNGRMIHFTPSSNTLDHGFFMFSPTFFYDYYKSNNYEIITSQVGRARTNTNFGFVEISNYFPGCLSTIGIGGLDDSTYILFFTIKKTKKSTCMKIPQQGAYNILWESNQKKKYSNKTALWNNLIKFSSQHPLLYKFIINSKLLIINGRRKGLGLKVVRRY